MSPASTLDPGAAARCAFRIVLEHDASVAPPPREPLDEGIRRRSDAAGRHRREVAVRLLELHGDRAVDAARDSAITQRALRTPELDLIVSPSLPPDVTSRRHGAPSLLVAARDAGPGRWRPVDVHNHLVTSDGASALRGATLEHPFLDEAAPVSGRRLRRGGIWRTDLLRLAHHHRQLERLDAAAPRATGGIVDRSGRLWWLPLDEVLDDRGSALAQYDARFAERVALLVATEARNDDPTRSRPGEPWWHRECEGCPFNSSCRADLLARDDVSLVRYTSARDQQLLRAEGVRTRRALASLDLTEVRVGSATQDEPVDAATPLAIAVGRLVHDAERLVRRARVELHGAPLRLVPAHALDAHRRDVEIDFDMESYDHATYIWGSLVTARVPTEGVVEGYRAFCDWEPLDRQREGALFARFFEWLVATVATAESSGRSVGLYCFHDAAELTQMRRALASGAPGVPEPAELEALLAGRLVDVHRIVTAQLQTAGAAGLKPMAQEAGFAWRDEAPSGEASMSWYETATGPDADRAATAKRRLLEYNEDDCRATRALRDWLDGPARGLLDLEGARPTPP